MVKGAHLREPPERFDHLSIRGGDGNDVTLKYIATGNTRTWDGGGANNLWSNPTNWSGNIAPVQGDALMLNSILFVPVPALAWAIALLIEKSKPIPNDATRFCYERESR